MDIERLFKVKTSISNDITGEVEMLDTLSAGTKSIYMLSLIEAYIEEKSRVHSLIMIEDPEIFLHPQLQKSQVRYCIVFQRKSGNIFHIFTKYDF